MSDWDDFFARHNRKKYTPVFNDYLDAVIADERLDLDKRFDALTLRNSWGKNSDGVINDDGVLMSQVECAKALGVFDAKGKPDRRRINDLVKERVRLGYMSLVGREMQLVDSPELSAKVFANSSPQSEPFWTTGEEEEKKSTSEEAPEPERPGFEDYIHRVWAAEDPAGYEEYQKVARAYKQWRLDLLAKYKDAEMSERVGQSDKRERPKGSDNVSERGRQSQERGRTNGTASINENERRKTSSSLLVRNAVRKYAPSADDELILQLVRACRQNCANATDEEIEHFVHEKARHVTKKDSRIDNPAGFLLRSVPKCFAGELIAEYREHSRTNSQSAKSPEPDDPALTRWRAEQESALNDPNVSEQEKHLIRLCLGLNTGKAKGASA